MTFKYTPIRNTAIKLLKQFGRPCTLLRAVDPTPSDPTMPWRVGTPTIQQFNTICVVLTTGFPKRADPIVDQDQEILMPGDIITAGSVADPSILCGLPTLVDRIQVGSLQLAILGIRDLSPDGTPIIFNLRGRSFPIITVQPRAAM